MTSSFQALDLRRASLPDFPKDVAGILGLSVRPGPDAREMRTSIVFDPERGAIGDRWEKKTWLYLPDGRPDPRVQIAICNVHLLALMQEVAGTTHHPGDTVFTDLDLSIANLPVGTRLKAGEAVLEISDVENDACAKFARHYGETIFQWIRLEQNRPQRLRGLFARVVCGGIARVGDPIARLPA